MDCENVHIFWTTWGISMKVSEKMSLMIILKVTIKNKGFILSLKDTFLKKRHMGSHCPHPPNHSPSSLLKVKNYISLARSVVFYFVISIVF